MAHKGVNWKSTTPYAPWRGGIWERLIGNVKYSLKRTIGRSLLTNPELQTLLCEIEAVVNTRPLTFQPEKELQKALRPVDFLIPYPQNEVELNLPSFGKI
jgi:hypothetical protein